MLIDLLKPEELSMMDTLRRNYAISEYGHSSGNYFVASKEMLFEWGNKKEYLYRWLGRELIISKEFEYTKSIDQLTIEMNSSMYNDKTRTFRNEYAGLLWSPEIEHEIEWKMRELISTESLANNTYVGEDFTIDFPNGRSYRVTKGCKAIKALGKIAEGFNLNGFEEFRIAHSQTLNQKKLKGELVLSIHPLDFMTMSDNDCGWSSCMSWQEYGEYRQGTVEMMNSPMVVIAYLKSSQDMRIGGHNWSNKKWRQLFVVDEDLIAGVKEYPYYNKEITNAVIDWLKELAKTNLGINFLETQDLRYGITNFNLPHLPEEKQNFIIDFSTGWMYNDFGCVPDCHRIAFNEALNPDIITNPFTTGVPRIDVYYSGKSQCMYCGGLDPDLYNEGSLCCYDCEQTYTCDYCGEHYDLEEMYDIEGMSVCRGCYEDHRVECVICGDEHLNNGEYTCKISVIPKLEKEEQREVYKRFSEGRPWCSPFDEEAEYSYFNHDTEYVCDDTSCIVRFEEKYLKEGCELKKRFFYDSDRYIFFDELNEKGKEFFGLEIYEDNKEFKDNRDNLYAFSRI